MSYRENVLRSIRFEQPEYIPMEFHINPSCWHHYDPNALIDLVNDHQQLFLKYPEQEIGKPYYELNQLKDKPYTDPWRCVWETMDDGITGSVHGHPLSDWSALENYHTPDPNKTDGTYPVNWEDIRIGTIRAKEKGQLVIGGLPHGHTFLRLLDIRGYENLIYDMADNDPRLQRLIGMITEFNYEYVLNWMELKPDLMTYPEDLGMQVGPMLSPVSFRKYIKPVYQQIMKPARESGCIVHMHSDGDIRSLVDDLIEGGVNVINLQDMVNGIDWISSKFAGRVCIDLDIDRQKITPFGTPAQIDALILEEVEKLGSRQGGLLMVYGLYPGVPLDNVKALMNAMVKYSTYYP